MNTYKRKFLFDFAISFASEDSVIADELANGLRQEGATVFYYPFFKATLWGKKSSRELAKSYGPLTRFVIPIISRHYAVKDFPQYEWGTAREEGKKRDYEFILPVRLDDTKLIGLHPDVIYFDLRKDSVKSLIHLCMRKLSEFGEQRRSYSNKWVATFGLTIDELLEEWSEDIPESVSRYYPELCDWLEEDLLETLRAKGIKDVDIVEDKRSGDALSVRMGFKWRPDEKPLKFGASGWWQLLEVLPYEDVYGNENQN